MIVQNISVDGKCLTFSLLTSFDVLVFFTSHSVGVSIAHWDASRAKRLLLCRWTGVELHFYSINFKILDIKTLMHLQYEKSHFCKCQFSVPLHSKCDANTQQWRSFSMQFFFWIQSLPTEDVLINAFRNETISFKRMKRVFFCLLLILLRMPL